MQSATLRGDMAAPLPPALTHLLATRAEEVQEPPVKSEADAGGDGQVQWHKTTHAVAGSNAVLQTASWK